MNYKLNNYLERVDDNFWSKLDFLLGKEKTVMNRPVGQSLKYADLLGSTIIPYELLTFLEFQMNSLNK